MSRLVVLACVLGVFLALFGSVIFAPNALIFRDAAHFYYPLYKLVQDEWNAGRVPLWNPYENAGDPLLGNPTAGVFYPLKVVFFLPFSYATLYKSYILMHVLLCAVTAYRMARHWGGSVSAAGVGAISYAFSAAVFFQYANIVFLVGAAWIPAAITAADGALRSRSWRWAMGFAAVLAVQVLGGDPETAYLCGLLAAAYAALLWWRERRGRHGVHYAGATTGRRPRRSLLLALMAMSSLLLGAVQVLPSWEYAQRSVRAAYAKPRNLYELAAHWVRSGRLETEGLLGRTTSGPHPIYEFSSGPWRWTELVWPNVNGRQFPVNTRWIGVLEDETTVWVPSLYMGVLPIALAVVAWRWRGAEAHTRWLQGMVALGLLGALGRFGVVWLVRLVFGLHVSGPPPEGGSLGGEVGGPYWLLTVVVPGFVDFRFPSKLLVFAALGISGLAAAGWDRSVGRDSHALRRWLVCLSCASALGVLGLWLCRGLILDGLRRASASATDAYFGPLDVDGAWSSMAGAGLHTAVVALLAWGLTKLAQGTSSTRRSTGRSSILKAAPALLLVLLAADVTVANRWLVLTGTQSDFETVPRALEIIRRTETEQSEEQPYRVYRSLFYAPLEWAEKGTPDRPQAGFRWERETLTAKYGLPYGVQYTVVAGTMAQYEYEFFVAPWYESARDMVRLYHIPGTALEAPRGYEWAYYPQRGFDYWNTKYFILPWRLTDPQGRPMGHLEHRGIISFLYDGAGKPVPRLFPTTPEEEELARRLDVQVVRNPDVLPRAWIVHRLYSPPAGQTRQEIMQRLLIGGAPDLRQAALIERDDQARVEPFHRPDADLHGERCRVARYAPQRVEIAATLIAPGMLVLADVFYPGWRAEVDGKPAEVIRVNRMMRGVGLPAGEHTVVFRYRPASFWWGSRISAVAWVGMVLLLALHTGRRWKRAGQA